jgi:diamine N-acetyltransferase
VGDMAVRSATSSDFEAVAALNREVQDLHAQHHPDLFKPSSAETLTSDVFERWLADTHLFVALADDRVVGYLQAATVERPETPYRFEQRIFYVHQVTIASSSRHQGHAHRLIETAIAHARDLGLASIELDTWAFNERAQEFFGQEGFRTTIVHMSAATSSDD